MVIRMLAGHAAGDFSLHLKSTAGAMLSLCSPDKLHLLQTIQLQGKYVSYDL